MGALTKRTVEFQFKSLNEVNLFLMQALEGRSYTEGYAGEGSDTLRVSSADDLIFTSSNFTFLAKAESTSLQTLQGVELHARECGGTVIEPQRGR